METLFSTQKGNFLQSQMHIASLRRPLHSDFAALVDKDLTTFKPRTKFTTWDIPRLMSVLGVHAGVDALGRDVFIDEDAVRKGSSSGEIPIGVFRHSLLFGVSRQAVGGRWAYDFANMNGSLLAAWGFGAGVMFVVRRMLPKRYVTYVQIPFGLMGFFVGIPIAKSLWKGAGIATLYVDHHSRRAIEGLQCEQCLQELVKHTQKEITERAVDKIAGNERQKIYDSKRTDLNKMNSLTKGEAFKGMSCVFHNTWK